MNKSKGLYTVSNEFRVAGIDLDGIEGTGMVYFATPEEIKEAHGKCGTCKHLSPLHRAELGLCTNDDSHSWDMRVNPATDYCNHHEPKEPTP